MAEQTARFALPLLDPGQAQKEMTHNEALALIDVALQPAVRAVGADAPPPAPAIGDQWVLGANPSGDWAGQARAIAAWTAGGWRFVAPVEGMTVWSGTDALVARFAGGDWTIGDLTAGRLLVGGLPVVGARRAAIAAPAGGTTVDAEARVAIGAILSALIAHGLIAGH